MFKLNQINSNALSVQSDSSNMNKFYGIVVLVTWGMANWIKWNMNILTDYKFVLLMVWNVLRALKRKTNKKTIWCKWIKFNRDFRTGAFRRVCGPIHVKSFGDSRYFVAFLVWMTHPVIKYLFILWNKSKKHVKSSKSSWWKSSLVERWKCYELITAKNILMQIFQIFWRQAELFISPYTPEQNDKAELEDA